MQLLLDYVPIVAFFAAYFIKGDFFYATGVLMAVMPVVLLIQWLRTRKLNRIYAASTVLVMIFGSLTLFYRNPTFLYWKPTVLNWVFALAFLGSQWIGEKPFIQRMLGSAVELTAAQWSRLSVLWVVFFIFVGAINLFVAYSFEEAVWVQFKLWGMLGLTFVFVIIQSLWLTAMMQRNESAASDPEA